MRFLRIRHATLFLSIFVIAALMLFPVAGRAQSKTQKVDDQAESPEVARIVDRIIAGENEYGQKVKEFSPRVETYIQYFQPPGGELGDKTTDDAYFLGRLKVDNEAKQVSFIPGPPSDWLTRGLAPLGRPFAGPHLFLDDFAIGTLMVDSHSFDRQHYIFEPVRWEYLGDMRCLAINVHPRANAGTGAFRGRIWVEDHNYAIVRLNGTRINPRRYTFYVHFDCWRENLQPGLWVPVYVYSQEPQLGNKFGFRSETRLWGYDLSTRTQQQEWTKIVVDAPAPVRDSSEDTSVLSPVESKRQLEADAEHNVLDRLEKARLIAPPGPVDKVLETVVNNLVVTNHLDNLPPIHCRVLLTSPLESFTLNYTIALSRGLVDVLPDEASLAMVLAHELAHIVLGHRLDSKYAFNDRLQVSDEELLSNLDLARSATLEDAADAKGIVLLDNSPYKDKLDGARLFLRAAVEAAPAAPHLFGAHLGNEFSRGENAIRLPALLKSAPELNPKSLDQIAALPLGSRVQVNAWDGTVVLLNQKAVSLVDAREKMPFRVTPVIPHLRLYEQTQGRNVAAQK
jgi:hypothetical protein